MSTNKKMSFSLLRSLQNNTNINRFVTEDENTDAANLNDIDNPTASPEDNLSTIDGEPNQSTDDQGFADTLISITPGAMEKLLTKASEDNLDVSDITNQLAKMAESFATIDINEVDQLHFGNSEPTSDDTMSTDGNDDGSQVIEDADSEVLMVTNEDNGQCVVFRNQEAFDNNKDSYFDDEANLEFDTIKLSDMISNSKELEDNNENNPWDYQIIEVDGDITDALNTEPTDDGIKVVDEDDTQQDMGELNFSLDDDSSMTNEEGEPDGDEDIEVLRSKYKQLLIDNGIEETEAERLSNDVQDRVELVNKIRELRDEPLMNPEDINANFDDFGNNLHEGKNTNDAPKSNTSRSTGADDEAIKAAIESGNPKKIKSAMNRKVNHFFGLSGDVQPYAKKISTIVEYSHDFGEDKKNPKPIKKSHIIKHINQLKDDHESLAKMLKKIHKIKMINESYINNFIGLDYSLD